MTDDLFVGLSDLEELGREHEAIEGGADPLAGEWRRLLEISTHIAGELDPDALLRAVMDSTIEITGAERGFLILINAEGEPEVRVAHNLAKEEIQDIKGSISRTVIEKIIFQREPMLINDVENNALLSRQVSVRNLQMKSVMGAPIICREQLLGMAYVDNSSLAGVFSQKDLAIFVTFLNLAAVAIDNAALFQSLRESSQKYRSLQEYHENILCTVPNGILVLDREGKLEYANPAAEEIYSWAREYQSEFSIQNTKIQRELEKIRKGETPKPVPMEINGRYYEVDFFMVLEREGKIGLLLTDLTDRKKLERQIYEEEKRLMMNQLAGGIAHEIFNQLFPIQGRAQLISMMLQKSNVPLDSEIVKSFQVIEDQVQMIARIAENLRNLSKPADPKFQNLDLTAVLKQAMEVMTSTSGKIKRFRQNDEKAIYQLKTGYADTPMPLRGDADQLQQMLMNLIINAAHALEDQGRGTLSVGTEVHGDKAVVYVEDSGPGIPEAVRAKIFEPYFTTKGEGKGTGLGLSIVKNIVRVHDGELLLDTEVGRGTRFEIHLPMLLRA
ncbi:MAG: GAF domain-containing protein [Candidatus Zixiibacteriota bacterium]|nr:MAG: GAF domain-containing protein [candidate division Zixibacteria bacterium]